MRRAALLLALAVLAGCGGDDDEAAPAVEHLTGIGALRSDFEQHEGKARVILLFAPT